MLRIVSRAKARHERLQAEPGVLDSIMIGRPPTAREIEGTLARALEHKAE